MKHIAVALILLAIAQPATAEEPSLPDLVAQAVGTANDAGINPITLDPETVRKASIGGQIVTSLVAGLGCPETAKTVGDVFGIAIQVAK